MGNLNNITNIYISKELNLHIFACLSYNEIDNYGLLNLLKFAPKLDKIKMIKCNCTNNNLFEILNTNVTNIQKKVLYADNNTFLIKNNNSYIICN